MDMIPCYRVCSLYSVQKYCVIHSTECIACWWLMHRSTRYCLMVFGIKQFEKLNCGWAMGKKLVQQCWSLKPALMRLNFPCFLDYCSLAGQGSPTNLTVSLLHCKLKWMDPYFGSRLCPIWVKGWRGARERGREQVEWWDAFMLEAQEGIRCSSSSSRDSLVFHTISGGFSESQNFTRSQ